MPDASGQELQTPELNPLNTRRFGKRKDVQVSVTGELHKLRSRQRRSGDPEDEIDTARTIVAHKIMIERARKRATQEKIDANYDSLTGLPNRRMFDKDLKKSVEEINNKSNVIELNGDQKGDYLLMMDLDRFKQVNDSLGHPTGDSILRLVPNVNLELPNREDEPIYRFGGDEYAQILKGVSRDQLYAVVSRYKGEMERMSGELIKIIDPTRDMSVGMSFGFAEIKAEMTPEEVLDLADSALMEVKRNGRGNVLIAELKEGKKVYNHLSTENNFSIAS